MMFLINSARLSSTVITATFGLALLAVGCGRPAYQLDTAPVRGKVTLDGKPLPSGYVVIPVAKGRMASGRLQDDGTFVMTTYDEGDGAQVGTHPVIVNELPPDEFSPVPKEKRIPIPARYSSAGTSGITIEVKPDEDNYLEIALTTKAE